MAICGPGLSWNQYYAFTTTATTTNTGWDPEVVGWPNQIVVVNDPPPTLDRYMYEYPPSKVPLKEPFDLLLEKFDKMIESKFGRSKT